MIVGEIGIVEGLDRLNPAHPLGHGLQVAPYGPNPLHRGLDLGGDAVLKPSAHEMPYAIVVVVARIAVAARRPLTVAPSIESM